MSQPPAAFSPKDTRLVAALKTPQALLAMVWDASRNRLLGAGLDGQLYAADLSVWPPAAEPAASPAGADGSNNNDNSNDNSGKVVGDPAADAKSKGKKESAEPIRRDAVKLWPLHDNYVSSLALREDVLVSASFDRTLAWWNAATGERQRTVAAHDGWVRKIAVLPGLAAGTSSAGNWRVVSVGDDMVAKVWDGATGELQTTLRGHAQRTPQGFATALYAVAAHPSGRFIAAADRCGECLVWEVGSGAVAARFNAADFYTYDSTKRARSIGGVRSLAFSPDGAKLAVAGIGQVTNVDGFVGPARLEIWDWQTSRRDYAGQAKHQAIQNDVQFVSPVNPTADANTAAATIPWIVTAGGGDGGGDVAFWKASDPAPIHLAKPEGHAHQLLFDPERGRMFLAGHGGFQIWRTY
ncbi:MAG: WD40 repeat domain-containing protein [Planctomycetota bacterium]